MIQITVLDGWRTVRVALYHYNVNSVVSADFSRDDRSSKVLYCTT